MYLTLCKILESSKLKNFPANKNLAFGTGYVEDNEDQDTLTPPLPLQIVKVTKSLGKKIEA